MERIIDPNTKFGGIFKQALEAVLSLSTFSIRINEVGNLVYANDRVIYHYEDEHAKIESLLGNLAMYIAEKNTEEAACKRIPIAAARKVSTDYDFPEVVIFGYDPASGKQHVTTYGRTLEQCKDAAKAGNYLKKALDWPDELCHAEPARARRKKNEKR